MADPSLGEIFQDLSSSILDSLNLTDLRADQLFSLVGNILIPIGSFIFNTIYQISIVILAKFSIIFLLQNFNLLPNSAFERESTKDEYNNFNGNPAYEEDYNFNFNDFTYDYEDGRNLYELSDIILKFLLDWLLVDQL